MSIHIIFNSHKLLDIRNLGVVIFVVMLSCSKARTQEAKYHYTGSDGTRIYLPLGKISFADSIASFELGSPRPVKKFRDSDQALDKPNYTEYRSPDFVSVGCQGRLVLAFTNNGFMNLGGVDLYVLEVGPAKERTKVEISTDGQTWIYAGTAQGSSAKLEFSDQKIDSTTIFHYVRLTDLQDQCDGITAGADIDAIAAINSVIVLNINADVLFDVDKWQLKPTANEILQEFVEAIKVVDQGTIRIDGHTDSDGENDYNFRLSQNRCTSVAQRLNKLIEHSNLFDYDLNPYGEENPKVANDTDENKQINRRVEIVLLPPKSYYENLKK